MGEKFKVRVNIEAVYEIELPDCLSDPLFIEFWKKEMWDIAGIEDIAKYAAEKAVIGEPVTQWDGLMSLYKADEEYPKIPDTNYTELNFDIAAEIITKLED